MKLPNFGRLFLASLIALNGIPVLSAPNTAPQNGKIVLSEWANALGMSGDLATADEIPAIEYWATGTVRLNGAPCRLTSYHVSTNYQVPGLRQEFTCVDAAGVAHHEIQVVANQVAWNESATGSSTAMSTLDERLVQLWSGPLAMVKAATAAGTQTTVAAEAGQTVVTFPVPGVSGATVKATLNAKHQAEQVDAQFGTTAIHTIYRDYVELNGSDLRFDSFFPRHIVQTQGGVTLVDLTVTKTSTGTVDLVMPVLVQTAAASNAVAAPMPPDVIRNAPSTWKDKRAFEKLDQVLREIVHGSCSQPASVIIRTKPGYRAGLSTSLKQHGNQLRGEFPSINAVSARVSCSDLQTLASFDSTLSVSVNARVIPSQLTTDVPPAPDAGAALEPVLTEAPGAEVTTTETAVPTATADAEVVQPGNLREAEGEAAAALQAPMLQTLLGDEYAQLRSLEPEHGSIGIAILDSGIEPGPDFGDRITAFYDFTGGQIRATAPSDEYGHGTHVAGLAASRYVGVAPYARLIGLKVLNARGQGDAASVLSAIEFAIANKDILDIQVLNLSLGHPIYEHAATDPMVQAVERAVRAGLVVVISAGNVGLNPRTHAPGYAGVLSPGNAPSAFSIGALRTRNTVTRDDDEIALFSSRGPTWYDGFAKPDFSAPGQNVLSVAAAGSTLRLDQEAKGNTGDYMRLNGTSMAAGVVSGMAALALQANRGLTPNALKAVLEYSALNVSNLTHDGSADILTQGAGAISGGALTLAAALDTTAHFGDAWLTTDVVATSLIGGQSVPWAERIIWANHIAQGGGILAIKRAAWARNVSWGQHFGVAGTPADPERVASNSLEDDDDNIVWGNSLDDDDNIVWGNSLDDDDNIVWGNSLDDDNIVWGNSLLDPDNIVWGNSLLDTDNIVWGNSLLSDADNIVWGNSFDDNIVWGNSLDLDNIVWGNSLQDDPSFEGRVN